VRGARAIRLCTHFELVGCVRWSCLALPSSWCRVGHLVGYATSAGRSAWEREGDAHARYTSALLASIRAMGHTAVMSVVLQDANAAVACTGGDYGQVPASYDNLGALGPWAYFHGVHGLVPLRDRRARVGDVVSKLLAAYLRQVCVWA
jgi:hypothetical protein